MVRMMNDEDSQVPIWSYRVNLDKRVRSDHPLRRIRAALDLSFVRQEVAHLDAANCHGLKRARWRGLWKQAIQDLLISTVQNLRKLLRHLSQTEPESAHELNQLLERLYTLLEASFQASLNRLASQLV